MDLAKIRTVGLMKNSRRDEGGAGHEFVDDYIRQKGWDKKKLTLSQLMEITAHLKNMEAK